MTDTNGLIERLRKREVREVLRLGHRREALVPVNPDGPEAADRLASQQSELSALRQQAEAMAWALENISMEYANQNLSHADFRLGAKLIADQELQSYRSQNP